MRRLATLVAAVLLAGCAAVGTPVTADLVVSNGRIARLDAGSRTVQAQAVRDGRILAVGSNAEMQALAGPATRHVDAGGRAVIPGLIDSHMHAVRAALSYSTEVNWIGATTIAEAMDRLRRGARARPGRWVIVAGGWTELQFAEKRKPTLAEVLAAVPDQPVWIPMFYSHLLLTPRAQETLALAPASLPSGMAAERDAAGNATGWLTANIDRGGFSIYSSHVALQWMLDGRTVVGGRPVHAAAPFGMQP
jgi:predicted amidohydrolase YtcJ